MPLRLFAKDAEYSHTVLIGSQSRLFFVMSDLQIDI
jgi:hypothetical protein